MKLLFLLAFVGILPLSANVGSEFSPNQTSALSQQITVTGIVADKGDPLPGVSVVIKGTSNGVVTDVNGKYSIAVSGSNAILVFSYIGYKTAEIQVGSQRTIDVDLVENVSELDEVIVVGYGTVKKSDLTGAISSVTSRSFLDQPGSSGNSVLSGRAPGVVVRRANGAPGEESTLRIRGVNSIMGNNDPLIVVDGNYSGMPNLYDIESIEILKDASATAIYGSRGANGVIIVTTKRGSTSGKNEVKVYSNVSFENIPRNWRYDMMNPKEYATLVNEMYSLRNPEQASQAPAYDLSKISGKGTDWQEELFQLGLSQNHKVVFSGGSNKMKYYITPTYSQVDGVILNTWSKSYGLNAKFDAELNDRISYQIEANLGHGDRFNPNQGRGTSHYGLPLGSALVWSPIPSVYNEDGTFVERDPHQLSTNLLNPVLLTTGKDTRYSNSGSAVGNISVKIIDGLVFNGKASVGFGTGGERIYNPGVFESNRADARQNNYENRSWLANAILTYTKTFEQKHNMSVMLGFEETQSNSNSFNANADDLAIESQEYYNLAVGRSIRVGSGYGNSALRSYFARGTYNYDGRYYFTGTFRADGSSKFRDSYRFSYFPSLGVAWRLSEEGFLKGSDLFQNLKLRGTWGITGSQAVDSYATYSAMSGYDYTWGTSTRYTGYGPGAPSNYNLQWEETTSVDFGLDITTLNNKLTFTFEYYRKQTDKLLSYTTVPAYNGGGRVATNIGSVENKGFEVNLNYVVFENKDWSYDVNLNLSHNLNKVLDIGLEDDDDGRLWVGPGIAGAMPNTPFIIKKGYSIGTIAGYKYLGFWQLGDVVEAARYSQEPGYYRYLDKNDDGRYSSEDYEMIGSSSPKFTWGFNNHLSWRKWNFNILIDGLHGRDILGLTYLTTTNTFDYATTVTSREGQDRWRPDNPNAKFSTLKQNPYTIMPNSDQWIQNGSYIKIRNISLARRFSPGIKEVGDIRVALSAQNVFRFTKYKGYDPEVSSVHTTGRDADVGAGLDWYAYPAPRSYTVSVSLEF